MSMMWGLGLVVGPALGGLAADLAAWRWSFDLLAVAAGGVALLVSRAVGDRRTSSVAATHPIVSVVMLAGLVVVAASRDIGPVGPTVWVVGLVAAGAGIGTAWPHLTVAAIGDDPDDGDRAAASVTP